MNQIPSSCRGVCPGDCCKQSIPVAYPICLDFPATASESSDHRIKQLHTNLTPARVMSRFISGGTNEQPLERDDEWLKAQKEIEEARRRKEEEGRQADGKSLYEVLQANKGGFALVIVSV